MRSCSNHQVQERDLLRAGEGGALQAVRVQLSLSSG